MSKLSMLGISGALCLLGLAGAASADLTAPVTKPTVERLEVVATDAGTGANRSVPNSWGFHQSRITRHADGTVRVLYLVQRTDSNMEWRLMRRAPTGGWTKEASGITADDVALLRDPRNDLAYVVAWPNSVPTVYAGPAYTASAIPGAWQVLFGGRHYGNAGIGPDGTVCLKVSREFSNIPLTGTTNTEYSCGIYTISAGTGKWSWSPMIVKPIGARHAYDYLYPNPKGLAPGLYGFSQADVYKDASGISAIDPTAFPYVFNGVRSYVTGTTSATSWNQAEAVPGITKTVATVASPPQLRMGDSYMDSKSRVFNSYYQDDPLNAAVRARKIAVTTPTGKLLTTIDGGSVLPSYGANRVFEDSKGRLWILWTARGLQISYVRVYPLVESGTATAPVFTIGAYTDISNAFYPYVIDGNMYTNVVRGGTSQAIYVDAIYNACTLKYTPNANIDQSLCYNADNSGLQRVIYARIHLPD